MYDRPRGVLWRLHCLRVTAFSHGVTPCVSRSRFTSAEGRETVRAQEELRALVDRQFDEAFQNIAMDPSVRLNRPAFCPPGVSTLKRSGTTA
jgi:hypothetical protein